MVVVVVVVVMVVVMVMVVAIVIAVVVLMVFRSGGGGRRGSHGQRCMVWGLQRGRRQKQASCPVGEQPLKQPFQGWLAHKA